MKQSTNNKLIRITTVPISLEKLLEDQLTFMSDYFDVTAVSSDRNRLMKFGEKNRVKIHHVEMTRIISPFKDLVSLYKMYKFLKKEKPTIVHSHTPKAGTIGMLAAKYAGVPNRLHTVAGLPLLEAKGIKRKLLNFVEKITYSAATKIYPNSFGLKEIIIQNNFCKENKLKVIANGSSNGINTSFFDPTLYSEIEVQNLKKEYGIMEDDFVFIFVGRLVADKGVNELVSAFNKLSDHQNNVKLLLVGPKEAELDPLKTETENIISSNANIIEIGFKEDVRPYLSVSNILVLPSYREGFPNVVLQAAAMNIPAIVSNINGCNEIIINETNGLIVEVKNNVSLYLAMFEIVKNSQLLKKISSQTRSFVIEKYDQNFVWNCILQEYQGLNKLFTHQNYVK